MKDFRTHFYLLLNKFKNGENFAYSRFSDGELRIMQNLELQLSHNSFTIGKDKNFGIYHPEDHKHFNPEEHSFYREKLMEAYQYLHPDYYVGLSCRCCVGDNDFQQMLDWYKGDVNSDNLTWSNLFLNGNYPLFIKEFLPLLSSKDVVYVLNENANLGGLTFKIKKDFRVGDNCIINDYHQIEDIKEWILNNGVKNHVFLFSASSLSNFMIHQLFDFNKNNTYIDIGTTLNPYLGMKARRSYHSGNRKMCVW